MNIEEIRSLCLSLNGVTEDVKWESNLCFLVGEKIFFLAALDASPTGATFKVEPEEFNDIVAQDGFSQAPYFAKNQWVRIEDIQLMNAVEWKAAIGKSYQLVKSKLTKKLQAEIDAL